MSEGKAVYQYNNTPVTFVAENGWLDIEYIKRNAVWFIPGKTKKYRRYLTDGRLEEIKDESKDRM